MTDHDCKPQERKAPQVTSEKGEEKKEAQRLPRYHSSILRSSVGSLCYGRVAVARPVASRLFLLGMKTKVVANVLRSGHRGFSYQRVRRTTTTALDKLSALQALLGGLFARPDALGRGSIPVAHKSVSTIGVNCTLKKKHAGS